MTSKRILESRARDAAKAQTALFHVVDLDERRRECRRMVTAGSNSFRHLPDRQPGAKARYIFLAERGADVPKPKRLSDLRTSKNYRSNPDLRQRDPVRQMVSRYLDLAKRTEGPVIVSLFHDYGVAPRIQQINALVRHELKNTRSSGARFVFRYVDPADWVSP